MANIQPYFIFNGQCEEAVKFYCNVFGGDIQATQKFKDAPVDSPEHWKNKIMHCNFIIRGDQLMASDCPPGHDTVAGTNINLTVNYQKNEKMMDEQFNKLAEGGRVTMPIAKTFWGARFGQLTDRFGVSWMFNQQLEENKTM